MRLIGVSSMTKKEESAHRERHGGEAEERQAHGGQQNPEHGGANGRMNDSGLLGENGFRRPFVSLPFCIPV